MKMGMPCVQHCFVTFHAFNLHFTDKTMVDLISHCLFRFVHTLQLFPSPISASADEIKEVDPSFHRCGENDTLSLEAK